MAGHVLFALASVVGVRAEGAMATLVEGQQAEQPDPERRLWTAVLLQAISEWQAGPVRVSRAAQQFLFEAQEDFAMVCEGAGLEPSRLREKLAGLPKRRDTLGNGFRLPVR
jgi:hypothetical protein